MGVGLVANGICNYIFMGILDMGVAGAAWGTNVGMFAYTLMGWFYFGRGKATFKSKLLSLKGDKKITISVVRLGMSSLMMNIMSLVQGVVVLKCSGVVWNNIRHCVLWSNLPSVPVPADTNFWSNTCSSASHWYQLWSETI